MTAAPGQAGGLPTVGRTRLGTLEVSRLGVGGMVLTRSFGSPDLAESAATLEAALDIRVNFLDTADSYAAGENETFIAKVVRPRRDEVVLASKFGLISHAGGRVTVDGRPEHVRAACEGSLARLGVDHLDLYYQHRVDPDVPITETVGAMSELVAEGKVRHLGLCEVDAEQLRRAHEVHPITAVQSEWSLWARQVEADFLPAARELGVGIVPYSPLGRGFLTGAIRREQVIGSNDLRGQDPRLHGENLRRNLALVDAVEGLARRKGGTAAQLALAWLMAKGDDVVPIPGVERRQLLFENVRALSVELDPSDVAYLDATFSPGAASGDPDATLLRGRAAVGSGGRR